MLNARATIIHKTRYHFHPWAAQSLTEGTNTKKITVKMTTQVDHESIDP